MDCLSVESYPTTFFHTTFTYMGTNVNKNDALTTWCLRCVAKTCTTQLRHKFDDEKKNNNVNKHNDIPINHCCQPRYHRKINRQIGAFSSALLGVWGKRNGEKS